MTRFTRFASTVLATVGVSMAAACGGLDGFTAAGDPAPSLVGTWTPSDGTAEKVFTADGPCRNAFYSNGKPLDIGGPSSCQLSSTKDSDGRYKLLVTQGPNRATYLVEFHSADSATVYTSKGKILYTLTRF
jgi:hypothetical protein